MAAVRPYKLIPLETAIQPRQRFEYEMADFLNNDSISDSEKLLLFQSAMSRLQKYRSYMTKPIKVDVVSKPSLPSEPQPSGPQVSRRDPTAVNQNLGLCAAPVNQNHGPGVAEPFSPQASTQEYEGLFEKFPVSYRQSAQLLYHHLHELDGFEIERGFNNIKIHDKLYNATDLLTDLISNRKSRYAIDSNIINFLADSNIPLSLIRNKGILKDVQNLRRISSEQVTESDGSFASVNSTVLESPSQSPIKSRQRFKTDCFVKTIQNGGGMDYYQGKAAPMVGYGAFSQFFGKMMRFAIPLLRKFVVPVASDIVGNTITDFEKGQDFGSSLKRNIQNKVQDITESMKQRGSGISRPPLKSRFFWRKMSFLPTEDSVPSVSSAISYFQSPNVDVSVKSAYFDPIYPVVPLSDGSPIHFRFSSNENYYSDMRNSILELKVKVFASDGNLVTDSDNVSYDDGGIMNTLFQNIQVFVNDTLVSSVQKKSRGSNYGSYTKEDGTLDPKLAVLATETLHLAARPSHDFFQLNQFIPPGLKIDIKFSPSLPRFVFRKLEKAAPDVKLTISEAVLHIRKVKIVSSLALAVEKIKASGSNLKIMIPKLMPTARIIPTGSLSFAESSLTTYGHLPSKVILGLVKTLNQLGSYESSPFKFELFHLSSLHLKVNGQPI
ncbi:hypothetical protein QYM36_019329 [Artemia franciscana]|uniref:Uncharacterized protein n=1 Tax=Artemia franciscana TaxID=6661 RepID=A0AA88KTW1_ARTSF|nr:hypothetical protein QYM36_019329 [Artemia franciscana]